MDIRFQLHHRRSFQIEELATWFAAEFESQLTTAGLGEEDPTDWFEVERSFLLPTSSLLSTIRIVCSLDSLPDGDKATDIAHLFLEGLPKFKAASVEKVVCLQNGDMQAAALKDQELIYQCEMQIREALYHILITNAKYSKNASGAEVIADHMKWIWSAAIKGSVSLPYENDLFFLMFDEYKKLNNAPVAPPSEQLADLISKSTSYGELQKAINEWGITTKRHKAFINGIQKLVDDLRHHRNNIMHNRAASATRITFGKALGAFGELIKVFWDAESDALNATHLELIQLGLDKQLALLVATATLESQQVSLHFDQTLTPTHQPVICSNKADLITALRDFCDEALDHLAPITPGQADKARDELDLQLLAEEFTQRLEEKGASFQAV